MSAELDSAGPASAAPKGESAGGVVPPREPGTPDWRGAYRYAQVDLSEADRAKLAEMASSMRISADLSKVVGEFAGTRADQPEGAAEQHAHREHYARNQEIAAIITGGRTSRDEHWSAGNIREVEYQFVPLSESVGQVRLSIDAEDGRDNRVIYMRDFGAPLPPADVRILERVNALLSWRRPRFEVKRVQATPSREHALSTPPSDADWSRYRPADLDQAEVNRRVSLAVRHIVEAFGLVPTDAVSIDITPGAVVVTTFEPHSGETGERAIRGDGAATTVVGSTWGYVPNGRKKPTTTKED